MNKLATILSITTVLLFLPYAKAWSGGAGHQVIAAEAYRQLSPALKNKVAEILKAHPDYEKWEKSFASESTKLDSWPIDKERATRLLHRIAPQPKHEKSREAPVGRGTVPLRM